VHSSTEPDGSTPGRLPVRCSRGFVSCHALAFKGGVAFLGTDAVSAGGVLLAMLRIHNREVLLGRAHYVATVTVGIRQGTGGEIELFF